MANSTYDYYDEFYSNRPSPLELGGINRSKQAKRDSLGRFMPDNEVGQIIWELDGNHGVKGGKERAKKARRDKSGKFIG